MNEKIENIIYYVLYPQEGSKGIKHKILKY